MIPITGTSAARFGRGGFPDRCGAWALIAGVSECMGAAFARALAERGMILVVAAGRRALLDRLAGERRCAARYGALWTEYVRRAPRRIIPGLY